MNHPEAEQVRPSAFYKRRTGQLRAEAEEVKHRTANHTLLLVILALLCCFALYKGIFTKQRSVLWLAAAAVPLPRGLSSDATDCITAPYNSAV
jgi:hypothetical protein